MSKGFLSGGALVGVVGQQLGDQALGFVGDGVPAGVGERELAHADLLHDLLIAGAIEWWHARQDDVQDDTARPDVTLLVVLLIEDLGGDVVGRAELLIKGFVGVELEGGAEIDYLDLIEVFVLLQKNILGLQITIDAVNER